jgi:putative oxidoreductase
MAEPSFLTQTEPRNALGDWTTRGVVAVFFLIFGLDKFSTAWVKVFQEIGFGAWFRYFTGFVEIFGALLVLIPRTAIAGLAILACTMAGAVILLVFVVDRPADSVFAAILFVVLSAIAWSCWKS